MSLKSFVNTPNMYNEFKEYLNNELEKVHYAMENARETEFCRLQGEARVLRRLLQLRERVNA